MQLVTPGIGDASGLVEQALQETFVLDIFYGLGEVTPGRGFTRLPVKQAGLALLNMTNMVPENWTASCVITGHLVAALRGQEDFRTTYHSIFLLEGRRVVQKRSVLLVEEALAETLLGAPIQGAR